ncbi:hypothetical protein AAG906_005836 [Vitis piasezkii]
MFDELASTLASIQEFMTRVLPLGTSHGIPFYLSDHCETTPPPTATVSPPIVTTTDDTRLAKREARDGGFTWDDRDDIPAARLPTKFWLSDSEHYSGIDCPKIHLKLYNTVIRAHGIDDAQLVAIFPIVGGHQTRPNDSISSFGGCWRAKDLKNLVHAAFSVEEAIVQGLWTDIAPSPDSKGKKPVGSSSRSGEVDTISYQHQRPALHSSYRSPTVRAHFSHP